MDDAKLGSNFGCHFSSFELIVNDLVLQHEIGLVINTWTSKRAVTLSMFDSVHNFASFQGIEQR